jgi:hypothetical protein
MDAQATLYALVGLWRLPLDVVIDPILPLLITVVLALIKNPKKQLRALACQDDLTGFIDVVTSPLTADEEAINSQYVAGTGGVSSHGNHMKLLKDLGGGDFGAGLETLWALFNYTADCPLDGSPEAYKEWVTSITDTFRSITGIGPYMSRQLARSCCLRFAPANLDLETLKSLDPDQGGHLAAEVGDHRKHPLDAAAEVGDHRKHPLDAAASVDRHREHPPSRRWATAASVDHHREHRWGRR